VARSSKKSQKKKATRARPKSGARIKDAPRKKTLAAKKKKTVAKVTPKKATAKKPAASKRGSLKKVAPRVAKKAASKAAPAKPAAKKAAPAKAAPKKAAPKKAAPKKAAPKKAAPAAAKPAAPAAPPEAPPKPRKPPKPEVSPADIRKIRVQLEAQREDLTKEATELEEGSFTSTQSEMSGEASFDEEYADAGSFTFEREKELSISNNIRDLLEKVNRALHAIDRGTYGICENCGNPIARDRLLALPYTTLCLRCKQLDERSR